MVETIKEDIYMKKGIIIGIIIAILAVIALTFWAIIGIVATPNLSEVQVEAQINADIRSAESIGRALRIWLVSDFDSLIPSVPTEYNKVEGITEEYVSLTMKPMSLKNAEYYVVNDNGRIKVAIAKEAEDVDELSDDKSYDGRDAGWAYVEQK
jgi:hypothetical protein